MQSNDEKIAFKFLLKQTCIGLLQQRVNNAAQAVTQAQETANDQEKSTVGDKHETARAISQADSDMNTKQLLVARRELAVLEAIPVQNLCRTIMPGAIFKLEDTLFFVAVGLGVVKINGQTVMVISNKAPLFDHLKMKKQNDKIIFRNQEQEIKDVY